MKKLNFKKGKGLLPAIIQDEISGQVLMLGFMNEAAYQKTRQTGNVWFYSRTKKRLWMKGEESGNTLQVIGIVPDCDQDTLLITARPQGPTCHTGEKSCFRMREGEDVDPRLPEDMLSSLFKLIQTRKISMPKKSYTTSLFRAGLNHICEKVEEESLEVIQAAKKEGKQRVIEESADLLYHLLVLIVESGVEWNKVLDELKKRAK